LTRSRLGLPSPRAMAVALLLCACLLPAAAPRADGPARTVDDALQRARAIVVEEGERRDKLLALHDLASQLLDTTAMGHRAMGEQLASRPAAQQEEFLELFDLLMIRAYLQKLLLFRDPEFAVVAEEAEDNAVLVRTKIFTAKDEFLVDYEMRRHDERWRATDVVIEGVSLTRNYRSQLHALLRSHDFEELLERMRRKTRALSEARRS
jgi:phospholipid transport system substrate-binding protein